MRIEGESIQGVMFYTHKVHTSSDYRIGQGRRRMNRMAAGSLFALKQPLKSKSMAFPVTSSPDHACITFAIITL